MLRHCVVIGACTLALLVAAPEAGAQMNITVVGSLGDLDMNGDSGTGEAAILNAAVACWAARVPTQRTFTLNVSTDAKSGGTIGQGAISAVNGSGIPTAGGISFDNDGSTTYYVDATPLGSSEFTPDPLSSWRYINGSITGVDLFSVVTHEIGHAMAWLCGASCGFNNPNYDARMNPAPGSFVADPGCDGPFPRLGEPQLTGCVHLQGNSPAMDVPLRGDGVGADIVNELSHPGINDDLMLGFYDDDSREFQSRNDVLVFANAYSDTINLPPLIDAGSNIVSECNATGGSNVTLNGSGTDPEDPLTFNWSCGSVGLTSANTATPSGFFALNTTTTCRMEVTDIGACPADADEMTVQVRDTTDPAIVCPAPIQVECTATGGTPKTDAQLSAFLAGASATDVCDATLTINAAAPALFPVGVATPVQFSTQDDSLNLSACSANVTVVDTTAPVITAVAASPNVLTPFSHKLVPVNVTVDVSDVCDASASCAISQVTSDEAINGPGDGSTLPDYVITGALTLQLRAERDGRGDGRVYTVHVTCTDDFNNSTLKTVNVFVPHDGGT